MAVARRELTSLSREKTILLALIIQLFVAAFSSFLMVGLVSMYDPSGVTGEVTVAVTGNAAADLVEAARGVDGLRTVADADGETAVEAFEAGRAEAFVKAERSGGRITVTAMVPKNSLQKTLTVVQLRAATEALERTERVERAEYLETRPLGRPPEVNASPYFGFAYTVVLPLLLFLPAFVSGSVAVDTITEEVERGTLDLLRVAPISLVEIVDGKGGAMVALVPAQVALWVGLLEVNGIDIANIGFLLLLASGLALALVAGGVALAFLVPVRQHAQLLYSLGVLLAFTAAAFLSVNPVTTMARLAIDSPGRGTAVLTVGYAIVGLVVAVTVRVFVARTDPESLSR